MENNNLDLVELSIEDQKEIEGGSFGKDVGFVIGYSIKWNLDAMKWGLEQIF